jgi:integrase
VRKHVALASDICPTLKGKRVTPHVLRHSAAMQLLQNGVDRTVIALWLGPESVESKTSARYVLWEPEAGDRLRPPGGCRVTDIPTATPYMASC